MKMTLVVNLEAGSLFTFVGGPFPILFSKNMEIELTPTILEDLLGVRGDRQVQVGMWNSRPHMCEVVDYDGQTNTLFAHGKMISGTKAYMDHLVQEGWVKDETALAHYHSLPISEESQAEWETSQT